MSGHNIWERNITVFFAFHELLQATVLMKSRSAIVKQGDRENYIRCTILEGPRFSCFLFRMVVVLEVLKIWLKSFGHLQTLWTRYVKLCYRNFFPWSARQVDFYKSRSHHD